MHIIILKITHQFCKKVQKPTFLDRSRKIKQNFITEILSTGGNPEICVFCFPAQSRDADFDTIMDRRIEKTKNSLINAFLELRAKKEIEKISVKELCAKADVNKSTFYTHYKDIYDLSEQLEQQAAADVLKNIEHPDYIFTHPEIFTQELYYAYLAQEHLIHILFSGSRENLLIVRIEDSLKQTIYQIYPEFSSNAVANTLFTLEIYGEFYAFMKCRHFGDDVVIDALVAHWQKTVELLQTPEYD